MNSPQDGASENKRTVRKISEEMSGEDRCTATNPNILDIEGEKRQNL